MEKNQGFLTNFNFPIKKAARRDQPNLIGLRRKINADQGESLVVPAKLNFSESPSDIQRKTEKAQQITPQGKISHSNKINKILVTNSSSTSKSKRDTSESANEQRSDTAKNPTNANPTNANPATSSKSLSFPEPFVIPLPQSEQNAALPDTELFTDDEDEEQEPNIPKPNEPLPPLGATDTLIGNSEDIEDVLGSNQVQETKVPVQKVSDTLIGNSEDIEGYRVDANKSDESVEEAIEVYDSEEEISINNMQPPIQSKSFYNCSRSSSGTVNSFFNHVPSLQDSQMAVRHSDIQRFKSQFVQQTVGKPPIAIVEENFGEEDESMLSIDRQLEGIKEASMLSIQREEIPITRGRHEESFESDLEHIEIGPTDESNNVEDDVIDLTVNENESISPPRVNPTRSSEIVLSNQTPNSIKAQISTPRSRKKNVTNIQISLKLKISIRDGSASDTSSSQSEKSFNSSPTSKETPSTPTASNSKSKSKNINTNKQAGTPNQMLMDSEEPKTPEKDELLIDDDLENFLNNVYGDGWKTPQLLSSCKSRRYRESLRKSIHANNFDSFVRHLPSDLESTRVTVASSEEQFRKPVAPISAKKGSSVKKLAAKTRTESTGSESDGRSTPKSQKLIPKSASKATPKYFDICDPDTSSDELSDDEEFNPNDTWNASSDEDYDSESERIEKRNKIRQSCRFEELTFTRDESIVEQKKIDLLLEKYEYTKPPQIGETPKKSKRKLFTHSHYEDEESEVITPKIDEKENQIPKDFKWPSPPPPVKEVKKVDVATPVRRTPAKSKSTPKLTPRELEKRFGPLSFLKSLDAEANRSLCDPDALHYRNNYKSKKLELAEKLFKLYNQNVFDSALTNVPMKWNKKLLNTAGRCNNSRRKGVRESALDLSDKVLTSADRLRCTLIHEMCHAAAWILDGENGHGIVWKRWAAKANSTFPELPKISVCHDYIIEYRYTYLCINCKAQSKAHSKSRKIDEIQCSICKGSIKLFENKKNAAGQIEMIPVEKKEATGFAKFVKLKFKEVKRPNMTHKEVMQVLSTQFQSLSVEEKSNL